MRYDYFVPAGFQEFIQKSLHPIHNNEIVSIVFAPKTDRVWRINQLIQDYKNKIPLVKVEFTIDEIDTIEDIKFYLNNQLGNLLKKPVGIFVINSEAFIFSKKHSLLDSMIEFQKKQPNLHFIFCFEIDFTHPNIAKYFYKTDIFSNVIYYPIYNEQDTLSFINYLASRWKFNINESLKHKLYQEFGGHFWLIKYAMRVLRDSPDIEFEEIYETEQIQFRIEQITNTLLESENNALGKTILGKKITNPIEKHSQHFLTKMGFIKNDKITIAVLEKYLRQHLPSVSIQITDNEILLNEVNVMANFSRNEKRALKALLANKNYVVSRDGIAKVVWPINTEDNYSDWAVDRLIARLRIKLIKLGMPKESIKTFRGRGYMLVN